MSEQEKKWSDKNWEERTPLEHFDGFLETFVVGKKSYIRKKEATEDFVYLSSLNGGSFDLNTIYDNFCKISIDKDAKDKTFDQIKDDIKKNNEIDLEILNHAIFLWGLPNKDRPALVLKDSNIYNDMPQCEVGGGGSGYNMQKVKGVRFILYIFTQIFQEELIKDITPIEAIKGEIVKICTSDRYENHGKDKESLPDGVKNFLLHLCKPEEYAPIAKTDDKKKIVKAFIEKVGNKKKVKAIDRGIKSIIEKIFESEESVQKKYYIDNEDNKDNEITFYDNKIEILKALVGNDKDFSFYKDVIQLLWKNESDDEKLSTVKLLEYKKAMVLYGPPGTGKTYTAMELAKEMLIRYWFKQYDQNKKEEYLNKILQIAEIKDDSKNDKAKTIVESVEMDDETQTKKETTEEEKNSIYYLQLHVNYSYENFIAGQIIEEGKGIVTKKGFIYDVIKKANDNPEVPFVVILDEMNRVDVSRVFGELFTAIEKRGTEVVLTLPDPDKKGERLTLTMPENVYFIGTMNEIDFSLEQIDFALRRRFIWKLAGYNSKSLEEIIKYRLKEDSNNQYKSRVGDFIDCCDNVNKTIKGEDSLGEKYHIGHAFFAEITEIIKKIESENPTENLTEKQKEKQEEQIKKNWDAAKNILWQISILPTLDAYCGTMERNKKDDFIKDCENIFLTNGKNTDNGL